ncbi:MoaD/ThiS family protein [Niabella ginsengisoli]|uniref:MoaD/ThiS family protein n=1 Tax=Niabella ginsengisoli TaxID=522298 RepID=A0ABS9SJM3_9BACT|nr:MoaD/ThiS family protein [Niabella ginsengisoli]MCH5598559.1 MoaD/ThiS family protein [Niabella ginsengisoli]
MTINVLFFGPLAEIVGNAIEMPVVSTLHELEQKLFEQFPLLKDKKYALSVNEKIVSGNVDLEEGFTIAFLPPFSGG